MGEKTLEHTVTTNAVRFKSQWWIITKSKEEQITFVKLVLCC